MAVVARPPTGPVIKAKLTGIRGRKNVHMSRRPTGRQGDDFGTVSWTTLLKVFHPSSLSAPLLKELLSIKIESSQSDVHRPGQQPDVEDLQSAHPEPLTWETLWEKRGLVVSGTSREHFQYLVNHEKTACLTISRKTLTRDSQRVPMLPPQWRLRTSSHVHQLYWDLVYYLADWSAGCGEVLGT